MREILRSASATVVILLPLTLLFIKYLLPVVVWLLAFVLEGTTALLRSSGL